MKNEGFRTLTKCFELGLGRKSCGQGDLSERKKFKVREREFLSREKVRNESDFALNI